VNGQISLWQIYTFDLIGK